MPHIEGKKFARAAFRKEAKSLLPHLGRAAFFGGVAVSFHVHAVVDSLLLEWGGGLTLSENWGCTHAVSAVRLSTISETIE